MPGYIAHPYDVLFFRGNKSFTFGEWYTEGTFPPPPSTFQGFVRSKILYDGGALDEKGRANDKNTIQALVGDDDKFPMDIVGPYLIKTEFDELYFPAPRDVIQEDEVSFRSLFNRVNEECIESDLGFLLRMPGSIPEKKLESLRPPEYLSDSEITAYRTVLDGLDIADHNLVFTEDRVGIGLDYEKRKTREGRFYVTPYSRLSDGIDLYFSLTGKTLNGGSQKLGGEAHLVDVVSHNEESLLEKKFSPSRERLVQCIVKHRTFRLVLLQPGIFKEGWFPFQSAVNDQKLLSTIATKGSTFQCELLGACMDSPWKIGGYSYIRNLGTGDQSGVTLKPMMLAVPTGSVYLFRIGKEVPDDVIKNFVEEFDNEKIGNLPYSAMGFNHVLLACGPEMKG